MATKLTESRHLYSWWWDSHISPKNSKWLQENLTDIDSKVKSMIKIINEDADSFARRAEMYYKKRPELMKLVEEFYRAYRALADRYDHATGELRLAHRTMIEAFPNQMPFMPNDDPSSGSELASLVAPHLDGLKQLHEMFQSGEATLRELKTVESRLRGNNAQGEEDKDSKSSERNHGLDLRTMILNESERAVKVEAEMQRLRQALAKMEAERDSVLAQYRQILEKLSNLEKELSSAKDDAMELEKCANEAQGDVKALRECLQKSEIERDSSLYRYEEASKRIASLEDERQELLRSEAEKQDALVQYQQSLEKITELEEKLRVAEENAEGLWQRNEEARSEVKALKEEIERLNKEKDDAYLRYQQCLEMISKLHNELMEAKEEVRRLKGSEDKCVLLEGVNQSLKLEANGLVQEIAVKDQELSEKDTELEKLMNRLQDERSRFMQVEAALHKLQDMNFQSQEEQRSLAAELRDGIRMLRELEICKKDLELENQCLKEENRGLNDLKLASCVAEKDMQDEILGLKEAKEKQVEQNEDLQEQFAESRQELEELYKKYQDLLMQVESDEEKMEKEALLRKLEGMESSLSDVKAELERSKEKVKALQESCKSLGGDKSNLMAEKSALLSQLQIITESMQKLLEKNVLLETSLQSAYIELEGLRAKSKGLEDFCRFLKDERSSLQSEKSSLVYRLECVEKKLEKLETRFTELEDKYVGRVEELRISLVLETKERECVVLTSEARLLGLEESVHRLHEENKCGKKEFEEQLEKGVSAQVEIFILRKFMEDMEERNSVLLAECCNNAEAAKFSEKLISELESENMMQHLETEYLMDRVENLRRGICQVLKALEIEHVTETDPEAFLKEIRRNLLKSKDESQELLVQNNVLSAVIGELSSEGMELKGRKETIDKEVFLLNKQNAMLEQDKDELLVRNRRLEMAMVEKESGQEALKAQKESLGLKQESLEKEYAVLQVQHSDARNKNRVLQEKLMHIEEEKCMLEDENSEVIMEALDLNNQLVVFKNSWIQTVLESGKVAQDMLHLQEAYSDLENEARALGGKLVMKEKENVQLRESLQQFEAKNQELNVSNDRLNKKCLVQRELLAQKDTELLEAEKRIKTVQFTNTELRVALDINRESLEERIVELSEGKEHQEKEIVLLQEANKSLENEVSVLTQEVEACKVREVSLNSELHERSSEFEIWEAEATSFYFDLQMSSVRESLLENKVQELSRLCEDLQDVGARRGMEIEKLNNKVSFLESDREGFRSKLASYVPVIASLKENIASLEQTSALQTKESESKSTNVREQSSSVSDELSDLQDLQSRIKTIESALIAKKNSAKESTTTKAPAKPRSRNNSQSNVMVHHDSERKPELRNGIHLKDIPLDHVSDGSPSRMRRRKSSRLSDQLLELWETSDLDSSHNLALSRTRGRFSPPRRNAGEIEKELGVDKLELTESKQHGKKVILERLASDAQKLASLQVSVQELRRKMEINKKSKPFKGVEYKSLRSQIHSVENSVVQLVSMNTELTKTVKGSGSRELVEVEQVLRRKVQEQSRKESERIGSLELEMQKIQSLMVGAEDEKSSIKKGGKNGSPRSRTRIILREFVYGPSRIRKQKKPRFCGCFRQPLKEV